MSFTNYRTQLRLSTTIAATFLALIILTYAVILDNPLEDLGCVTVPQGEFKRWECPPAVGFLFDAEPVAAILIPILLSVILVFIPLYFLREEAYRSWRFFAVRYAGAAAIVVLITPSYGGGGWGYSIPIDKLGVTMFLSAVFVIISYFLMVVAPTDRRTNAK